MIKQYHLTNDVICVWHCLESHSVCVCFLVLQSKELKWDFNYIIFKDSCFRVYIQRHLVLKYIHRQFPY